MKATKEDLHESGRPLTQEEFIQKIKDDNNFSNKWGDLGPVYGKQWRNWTKFQQYEGEKTIDTYQIDQIQNLIHDLKTNPDSRRLMVSAWNPADLPNQVLPPCHYGFQVYTRELSLNERGELFRKTYPGKSVDDFGPGGMEVQSLSHQLDSRYNKANIPTRAISLMWNQRSVDTFLGLPFNIASYGLLLEIIAKEVNMIPDELIGNLGDVHLYSNHIEQAREQIGRQYTADERLEMLKQAMGDASFELAVSNLMPFGGGLSEYYDSYKIPHTTREPYPLPKLGKIPDYLCMKDNWECYEPSDFTLENYQSHPTIKAPLSN